MIGLRGNSPSQSHDEAVALPHGFDDPDIRLGDLMRGRARATLGKSCWTSSGNCASASYVATNRECDISAFDTPSFIAGYVRSYALSWHGFGLDLPAFLPGSGFQPAWHGARRCQAEAAAPPSDPAEALANLNPIFLPGPKACGPRSSRGPSARSW